jgi:hypothetical protein
MVHSCPGWSSEETLSGMLSYTGFFEPVACTHAIQKTQTSQNVLGKKLTRNAPSTSPSKNTTYKMFEELMESQLITKLEIREGKNEAELMLKRLMDP